MHQRRGYRNDKRAIGIARDTKARSVQRRRSTFAGVDHRLVLQAPMPTGASDWARRRPTAMVYAIGGLGGELRRSRPCNLGRRRPWSVQPGHEHLVTGALTERRPRKRRRAAIGNTIYVVGGHVPGGEASGVVEVFNGSSWTTLPQSDWMPTAQAGLGLVTDGTYLYAIGGNTQAGTRFGRDGRAVRPVSAVGIPLVDPRADARGWQRECERAF